MNKMVLTALVLAGLVSSNAFAGGTAREGKGTETKSRDQIAAEKGAEKSQANSEKIRSAEELLSSKDIRHLSGTDVMKALSSSRVQKALEKAIDAKDVVAIEFLTLSVKNQTSAKAHEDAVVVDNLIELYTEATGQIKDELLKDLSEINSSMKSGMVAEVAAAKVFEGKVNSEGENKLAMLRKKGCKG